MKNKLNQNIFNMVEDLRGNMDVSEYKNLLLGLFFYKYLCDNLLRQVVKFSGSSLNEYETLDEITALYRKLLFDDSSKEELINYLVRVLGYDVEPDYLFNVLANSVNNNQFVSVELDKAFKHLSKKYQHFYGLFDDIDLQSKRLGSDTRHRSIVISEILDRLMNISIFECDTDNGGDIFEALINRFASNLGKTGEEFYTPQMISRLVTNIVTLDQKEKDGFTIFDPTMGSGSLILNVRKYLTYPESVNFYGQELNTNTYNLARMNLIIHGIKDKNMHLRNGDSLGVDWPNDSINTFDSVVMNPPYSAKWSADPGFASDHRFKRYGKMPPKSKADLAFLLHGYYHLNVTGTMAILLPHGILFRGASEKAIRKRLIEDGSIYAVIGLPANLFFGTSIPMTLIVLKKNRKERDILFIDASNDYIKEKSQNDLSQNDLDKIVSCYVKRRDIEKYAHVASFEEIKDNDYNLNIPRYVNTFEEAAPLDILEVRKEIENIQRERQIVEKHIFESISSVKTGEKNSSWKNEILKVIDREQ